MVSIAATVTDSAGQSVTVVYGLAGGAPQGSGPTAPILAARATDASGDPAQAFTALRAAVGPALGRVHGHASGLIPAGPAGSDPAAKVLALARDAHLGAYLSCESDQVLGGWLDPDFIPWRVTAPITALTQAMVGAGVHGHVCLDPIPQNADPSWPANLLTGGPAQAAAARWRAAQRAAARAVWQADPTGSVGYSITLLAQRASWPWLDRDYWDPAVSAGDELPGEQQLFTAAEQAKVLLGVSAYPAVGSTGAADTVDFLDTELDYWRAAGYRQLALTGVAYNVDDFLAADPDEARVAELLRGTDTVGAPVGGSLGQLLRRRRADATLRLVSWTDSYRVATDGAGSRGSLREDPRRPAALLEALTGAPPPETP